MIFVVVKQLPWIGRLLPALSMLVRDHTRDRPRRGDLIFEMLVSGGRRSHLGSIKPSTPMHCLRAARLVVATGRRAAHVATRDS